MHKSGFAALSIFVVVAAATSGCATASDSSNGGQDAGAAGDGSGGDGAHGDSGASHDGGAGDSSTGGDGGSTDGGNTTDVAVACKPVMVADAGTTAVGTGDAGGVCAPPTGGQCGPIDVAPFQASWHPPSGFHQGLCTSAQIDGYYAACLDPNTANATTCANFDAACTACLSTDETAASYGPLIAKSGFVNINIGGCIELLEPCNHDCAQAYMANDECAEASCSANCPVVDDLSFQDYLGCTSTASQCACSAENARAQCATLVSGSMHPAAQCLTATTFEQFFKTVAPIFCGQ